MKTCVFGAGAMGTSLGVLLTRAGVSCDLVSRNAAHIEALKRGGARLTGEENSVTPVSALLPREMAEEYDVIFLCTKQRDNVETARGLLPFLKADGALVTVQNGLPERTLAPIAGESRIYGAVLSWGAQRREAGTVDITSRCGFPVALGAYGSGKRTEELAQMLRAGGASVTVGELMELRYAKLAANASLSTLSAISGLTFGELAKHHKKLCLKPIREVLAVSRARGCKKLPFHGHDLYRIFGRWGNFTLPFAVKSYRDSRSGMLLDLEAGRRCDVDFVAGAAVAEGEALGVPTPFLARAVELVHEIENGFAEIAPETLQLF